MTKRNVKGGLQIPRALIFATQKDIFLFFCLCLDHKSFGKNTMQEEHSVGDMWGSRGNFEGKISRQHNYPLALHSLYLRPRIFIVIILEAKIFPCFHFWKKQNKTCRPVWFPAKNCTDTPIRYNILYTDHFLLK